ncbi:MAG TPA: DUF2505 family protein [Acidimicrobiales bacterium]|jgi:hypothetical protein
MRFELTHRYAWPAAEVAAAYADADLYPALAGLPKLGGAEVLSRQATGDEVELRIRYRFTGDLNPAVTAVVDPAKLTWVEESTHDLATGTVSWRLVPDHYADRLKASGRYRFTDEGGRAVRRTDGDLKVRALLVASTVERAIVSGLEEHFDAEVAAVDAYLADR